MWWFPKIKIHKDRIQFFVLYEPRRVTVFNPKGKQRQYLYLNSFKKSTVQSRLSLFLCRVLNLKIPDKVTREMIKERGDTHL